MIDHTHQPAPAACAPAARDVHPALDALSRFGVSPHGDAFERAWMRILDAYDTLHQAGIGCPSEGHMFRLLRNAARQILLTARAGSPECWLVPATPRDLTACHLIAVCLLRRGEHVRFWPWQAPAPGACLTVGANWRALLGRPLPGDGGAARMAASA